MRLARSYHPNGTKMTYAILSLDQLVAVDGQLGASSPMNTREDCIGQIQLVTNDPILRRRLLLGGSSRVKLGGVLFHGHTAWHMRPILMDVSAADIRVSSDLSR